MLVQIERLETAASKRKGGKAKQSYGSRETTSQLRQQLQDMARQRDELQRELSDASRRKNDMSGSSRRRDGSRDRDESFDASLRAPGSASVSIREPLRDRYDKELTAAKQKLIETTSKHAIEVDRLRAKLSESRARVSQLEEAQRVTLSRMAAGHSEVAEEAEAASEVLQKEVYAMREQLALYAEENAGLSAVCGELRHHVKEMEAQSSSEVLRLRQALAKAGDDLRQCGEQIKSLESSRNAVIKAGDDRTKLKEEIVKLHQQMYELEVKELEQATVIKALEGDLAAAQEEAQAAARQGKNGSASASTSAAASPSQNRNEAAAAAAAKRHQEGVVELLNASSDLVAFDTAMEHRSEVTSLEEKLAAARQEISKLEAELESAQKEVMRLNRVNGEAEGLRDEMSRLQGEIEREREEVMHLSLRIVVSFLQFVVSFFAICRILSAVGQCVVAL